METIYFRKVSVKERLPDYRNNAINMVLLDGTIPLMAQLYPDLKWYTIFGNREEISKAISHWLEEIPLPEIIQEKEREIEALGMDGIIQRGEMDILIGDIAEHKRVSRLSQLQIQEKDTQIQELKEDVLGFGNFIGTNYQLTHIKTLYTDKKTFREILTIDELYIKYKDSKKQ